MKSALFNIHPACAVKTISHSLQFCSLRAYFYCCCCSHSFSIGEYETLLPNLYFYSNRQHKNVTEFFCQKKMLARRT